MRTVLLLLMMFSTVGVKSFADESIELKSKRYCELNYENDEIQFCLNVEAAERSLFNSLWSKASEEVKLEMKSTTFRVFSGLHSYHDLIVSLQTKIFQEKIKHQELATIVVGEAWYGNADDHCSTLRDRLATTCAGKRSCELQCTLPDDCSLSEKSAKQRCFVAYDCGSGRMQYDLYPDTSTIKLDCEGFRLSRPLR